MKSTRDKRSSRSSEYGGALALIAVFMPGLLLLLILVVDGFVFVEADIQLHNAVESAAEAGLCHYLEHSGTQASTTARVQNVLQKVWMITQDMQDLSASIDVIEPGSFDQDTKVFTALAWGNPSIHALRLSVNHESGAGNSITGFFTHLMGMTGSVTLTNDMIAYRIDPIVDVNDNVYKYRFYHCEDNTCS